MRKINPANIILNSRLEELDLKNNIAIVNGEKYHFKRLINTMPLNKFVCFLPNEYRAVIDNALSCNKVLVFNLGFDKAPVDRDVHWTYIPMKDINFYRIGYYNNILGNNKLSMYVEIGFPEKADIDVESQLNKTLENLHRLRVINDHKLVAYNSLVIDPGYVHITQSSIQKVGKLQKMLNSKDIYSIGRYGKWTYCSIEDCMIDAMNLAKSFKRD